MYSLTDPQLCSTYGASSEYERGPFFCFIIKENITGCWQLLFSCWGTGSLLYEIVLMYKCNSNKTCTAKSSCSTDHEKSSTNKNILPKVITHALLNFEIWGEILFCCIYKILDARFLEELWRNTSIGPLLFTWLWPGVSSQRVCSLIKYTYLKVPTVKNPRHFFVY